MHLCLTSCSFGRVANPTRRRAKSNQSSRPVASRLPIGSRGTHEGQVVAAPGQIAQKFLCIGTFTFPPRHRGQTVVGASRRRAAPGSQAVASFATPLVCWFANGRKSGVRWRSAQWSKTVSFVHKYQRPNPSIERTSNGGARRHAPSRSVTPLAAAHVKR